MQLFITIFFALILTSCGTKTYKLSDTDFDWIPYKGKDTLVFTSATGDTDTLFLRNGKIYREYQVDPLSLKPPDSTETFDISYKDNYFDSVQQINNFRVFPLIILKRTKENNTMIGFSIITNDDFFYGLKYFKRVELENFKLTTLQTTLRNYDDVFVIEPDTSVFVHSNRRNYVTKMYWSKSEGLIRFDKNNNVYYTLTKKHGL